MTKKGIPKTYIPEEVLLSRGAKTSGAKQIENIEKYAKVPRKSGGHCSCAIVCDQFCKYPVTDGLGVFNGIRIIPKDAMCVKLPWLKCAVDMCYQHPIFFPKPGKNLASLLEILKDELHDPNCDGKTPRLRKLEMLKKYLRDHQKNK
jgi:hypothetical protein